MEHLRKVLKDWLTNAYEVLPDLSSKAAIATSGIDLEWWIFQAKGRLTAAYPTIYTQGYSGLNLPPEEVVFLLREIAYCCWGIGAIEGCKVFGKADFQEILKKWCNLTYLHDPPFAISKKFYQQVLKRPELVQLKSDRNLYPYLNTVAELVRNGIPIEEAMAMANRTHNESQTIDYQLSKPLTAKLSRKLIPFFSLKTSIHWIPLIHQGINTSLNIQLMDGILNTAKEYYRYSIK